MFICVFMVVRSTVLHCCPCLILIEIFECDSTDCGGSAIDLMPCNDPLGRAYGTCGFPQTHPLMLAVPDRLSKTVPVSQVLSRLILYMYYVSRMCS